MNSVKWTKSYDLLVDNKHFRVFLSEQDGDQFYASCLWYEGDRVLRASGQMGSLNFDLENRLGNSEEDALNQILDWVKKTYGEEFKLKESK